MRIQLALEPSLFAKSVAAGPSSGPLAQLGGEIVLIELQGELNWEGDKAGGVVGVIGLDRPDKPTLHLGPHHLLHGKFANLPKPLAVIRRGRGTAASASTGGEGHVGENAVQGDLDEEEEEEEEEEVGDEGDGEDAKDAQHGKAAGSITRSQTTPDRPIKAAMGKRKANLVDHSSDEEEDDSPLFPEDHINPNAALAGAGPSTPVRPLKTSQHNRTPASSSPFLPPSSIPDFSSELDFSSPPPSSPPVSSQLDGQDDEDEEEGSREEMRASKQREREKERAKRQKIEQKRAARKAQRPERTRTYEVVGLVRRKVVFALRPEPIVTATILPE